LNDHYGYTNQEREWVSLHSVTAVVMERVFFQH